MAHPTVEHFLSILPREAILDREVDRMTYDADAVTLEKFRPALVLLPTTSEQVSAILKVAHANRFPVVTRGAGTGLSGGALALEGSILLVTVRMNRILEIDTRERWAIVEPGVVNSHLVKAAKPYGLTFAPDPSSGAASTIGGNIAENAGGPHCLKYGATAEHVLELEITTQIGERFWVGSHVEEGAILSLLLGSEGTLAIVTKAKVRLTPVPEAVETLLVDFRTVADASKAVGEIIASGIVPAALEMIDSEVLDALEAAFRLGFPVDAGALLILELDGKRPSMKRLLGEVERIVMQHHAREVRIAKDDREREALWKARKRAFGALGRVSPSYYTQDGVIPRHTLPEVLEEIAAIGKRYQLRIANIFHAGDGNLHPAILYDERDPAQVEKVLAASADILKLCISKSGSITGEHGVGIEKQEALGWMFGEADIEIMEKVRKVFNPDELLNPGKFLPSDHSCREVGVKHRKVPL